VKCSFTILHISDLHKPKDNNYKDLLASIQIDFNNNYSSKGISKPEIIVVSGDLIEGAEGKDANHIIQDQYNDVAAFLEDLVNLFLDGDKARIIIVPGNHDYNREISKAAFDICNPQNNDENKMKYFSNEPNIRWSWKNYSFYQKSRSNEYDKRFCFFEDFYNKFYKNIRHLPEDVEKDGYIIDLPEFNITFACFNSCFRLDHLNTCGCISPSALSNLLTELNNYYDKGRIIVGVWHHNVSGLPYENNYLDYRILDTMISANISIGLYGHQHKSNIINEYKDLSSNKKLLLISSGSLYGSKNVLPPGVSRQYNLVSINEDETDVTIRINVRKDCSIDLYAIPLWQDCEIGMSSLKEFCHELKLKTPLINKTKEYISIQDEVNHTRDFVHACKRLKEIGLKDVAFRKLFDDYILKLSENHEVILELIDEPANDGELILLLDALIEVKDKGRIASVLSLGLCKNTQRAYIREQIDKAKYILNY